MPEGLHDFLDYDSMRTRVYDGVMGALKEKYPMENERYRMELGGLKYGGPSKFSLQDQKKAILQRKSIYRPIKGIWRLIDKATNKTVDERKATIMHVPHLTSRGTYILRGNEYTVANQMRLRSGVYARQKENGELESHFNIRKGGPSFRIFMEPKTGIFRMQVGQAKLKMYPILRGMGVADKDMIKWMGPNLFQANVQDTGDQATIRKVWDRMANIRARKEIGEHPPSKEDFKTLFDSFELDPDVTQRTLGARYDRVTPEVLMRSMQKLINVNDGKEATDDRDSLAYQETWSADDFFKERIKKDSGRIASRALWKATLRGNLSGMAAASLNPQMDAVFFKSGVAQPLEEINPVDAIDQNLRLTRLGEGGLSAERVTLEARNVNPSQFMFVDPIRTPECYDDQTEVMTRDGWKFWRDITKQDVFACLIDGYVAYLCADSVVAQQYTGLMYGARSRFIDYMVTPNHRMYVRPQKGAPDHSPVYRVETPEYVSEHIRKFLSGGPRCIDEHNITTFKLPTITADGTENQISGNPPIGASLKNIDEPIDIYDWCEFIGWYLAEGCCGSKYVTKISQSSVANPVNCKRISQLLDRLPFAWSYSKKSGDFSISGKQLNSYCKQFGLCADKYIPNYIFKAPLAAKEIFVDAALQGDGRMSKRGKLDQYCTTSKRLADDMSRLLFTMGISSRISFEPDDREDRYLGCYIVNIHSSNERVVVHKSVKHPEGQYYTKQYDGMVYCATVHGGFLYVRRNNSVGFWCGNSSKIGVDSRVTVDTLKGDDRQLYTKIRDVKSGKIIYLPPVKVVDATVSFPGELAKARREGRKYVKAMVSGRLQYAKATDVQYEAPSHQGMFTLGSNMVPMISAIKGGRLLMGAKMASQALPLSNPEAPLVRSRSSDGDSFYDKISGNMGAIKAQAAGEVVRVTRDRIIVKQFDNELKEYELYDNFPLNRKTFLSNSAKVKIGDVVRPGQMLASSNFTDESGTAALGKNLKVAYVPYRGLNFEDAVVISQTAANKLSSEHMYTEKMDLDNMIGAGRNKFIAIFPSVYNRAQLDNMDEDGVVKPGSKIIEGDPLILAVQRRTSKGAGMLYRGGKSSFRDSSITWSHHTPGVVTDVWSDKTGIKVAVKTYAPMEKGDKMSGRYGDKGVVAKVIPDDQMPVDEEGNPLEVLLNPLSVISRVNPAQMLEAVLGKIAAKRGKPYILDGFSDEDLVEFTIKEMETHGVKDTEDLFDPMTKRKLPKILTGRRYIQKLHHTAASKESGRALGAYTSEGLPSRGEGADADSPKRIGMGEMQALLSHGAIENIKDIKIIRGQRNDDYWRAMALGYPPPSPNMPNAYKKFMSMMRAAGINTKKKGNYLHLTALTDKDIDIMSSGAISKPETVKWLSEYGRGSFGEKSLDPIEGGLFDRGLTGGHGGNRWSHINLSEPMPQPAMEDPIRRLLNMTKKEYMDVIAGTESIPGAGTGGQGVFNALSRIKIGPEIDRLTYEVKTSSSAVRRDASIKKLGYLQAMQKNGMNPSDLVVNKVPVLPPIFRPITANSKFNMVAGINLLYMDLMNADKNLKDMKAGVGSDSELTNSARLNVYNSVKAVTGLGDPIKPERKQQKVRGVLGEVFGSSPKMGLYQRRLLGTSVDMSGRATITPNPSLDMDQIGIPEDQAWKLYGPFVTRRLISSMGDQPDARAAAIRLVVERDPKALVALEKEMSERPVLASRAPALHRYSVMAFKPIIAKGRTLQLSPAIVPGFNADFDGDAMNFHVIVSDKAVEEAKRKLLPSQNLRSPADFGTMWEPRQEFLQGLYSASTMRSGRRTLPRYDSARDVIAAFNSGKVNVEDVVSVKD